MDIKDTGFTEQKGKTWGKVFVNFSYQGVNFCGLKHFVYRGRPVGEVLLCLGKYEDSSVFKQFSVKHENLNTDEVLKGEHDHHSLFDSVTLNGIFGTLSRLTSELIQEVEELKHDFFEKVNQQESSTELDKEFSFSGSYYKINKVEFRDVLTIDKIGNTDEQFDAVAVMMNPGGSYPISKTYKDLKSFTEEKDLLTPCSPDETQYQIARLMKRRSWTRVLVLNLFDICDPDSKNIILRYKSKDNLIESIFHEDRRTELQKHIEKLKGNAPIIIGWGVSGDLFRIKRSIKEKVLKPLKGQIVGIMKEKEEHQYYHPWPRDCFNELRFNWAELIDRQIIN